MLEGLVTTIIPVFNRVQMLREAVESVLAQTYRPIEVIIVDDGSTDDTPQRIADLMAQHPEIAAIRRENGGPGAARESGRLAARGEFVQHLDSDDLLMPRKLELQVAGLRQSPECDVSYGWTRLRHADGTAEPSPWKRSGERIDTMFPSMLQSRWWDTPTPLYRRSVVDRAGAWLPLRAEEDWEFDARVASLGVRLHQVEEWVCEVRRHRDEHASDRGLDPARLRDRAAAHAAILKSARRAGIDPHSVEMQQFARELFLLARQCGAAGLTAESSMLFDLARVSSGPDASRLQFRVYAAIARLIGWRNAGRLAAIADRMRS